MCFIFLFHLFLVSASRLRTLAIHISLYRYLLAHCRCSNIYPKLVVPPRRTLSTRVSSAVFHCPSTFSMSHRKDGYAGGVLTTPDIVPTRALNDPGRKHRCAPSQAASSCPHPALPGCVDVMSQCLRHVGHDVPDGAGGPCRTPRWRSRTLGFSAQLTLNPGDRSSRAPSALGPPPAAVLTKASVRDRRARWGGRKPARSSASRSAPDNGSGTTKRSSGGGGALEPRRTRPLAGGVQFPRLRRSSRGQTRSVCLMDPQGRSHLHNERRPDTCVSEDLIDHDVQTMRQV